MLEARTKLLLVSRMLVAASILSVVSLAVFVVATLVVGYPVYFFGLAIASNVRPDLAELVLARPFRAVVVLGVLLNPYFVVRPAWRNLRAFRTELRTGSDASESHPELASTVRRLAQQAGIPEPDLHVTGSDRPESYTLGGKSSGAIFVSQGLVSELTEAEVTAVLAHEVSHLVNGDSRIVGIALVPMIVAEDVLLSRERSGSPFSVFVFIVNQMLGLCCQIGVSFLSRGRELAADEGAVALTGDPVALASALSKLDEEHSRPSDDIRSYTVSAGTLDILPPERSIASRGPFRTHPPTEARLERLERLVAEAEP